MYTGPDSFLTTDARNAGCSAMTALIAWARREQERCSVCSSIAM